MSDEQQRRLLLGEPGPGGLLARDVLRQEYERFLQADVPPHERLDEGLQGVFRAVFPISDFNDTAQLTFVSYELTPPRLDAATCRNSGKTFASGLKVTVQLLIFDTDEKQGKTIRDIKEQEVYFGELPALSPEGTFVINGIDRVVVRQLADSPGLRFLRGERGKLRAVITPHRGSRLAFEIDRKGTIQTRIDGKKTTFPATVFLRAMGHSREEILAMLCTIDVILIEPGGKLSMRLDPDALVGRRATCDIRIDGEMLVKRHAKFTRTVVRKLKDRKLDRIPISEDELIGRAVAVDVINQNSGEVLRDVGEPLRYGDLDVFRRAGIAQLSLVLADGFHASSLLLDTLRSDRVQGQDEALMAIYRALRPGDAPTVETARYLFDNLFFGDRFRLSRAGRLCLSRKLRSPLDAPEVLDIMCLTREDVVGTLRELIRRDLQWGPSDDTEDASESVVRGVGETLGDVVLGGLWSMARAIKERMSMSQEIDTLMPHDLINARPLQKQIEEFFVWSRVSERANQTSPLAEVAQRRWLSSVEPYHKSLKRGGFPIHGQHESYLGVFCALGRPRAGAAPALSSEIQPGLPPRSTCAPFAQLSLPESRPLTPHDVFCLEALLIPFLGHDAHEVASAGIWNLCAAVPPLRPDVPLVATGLEAEVAHASGLARVARGAGRVKAATCREVVVCPEGGDGDDGGGDEGGEEREERHVLRGFEVLSWGAFARQRPTVRAGQRVEAGALLAAGPGVAGGELALGHNMLVALLPGPTFGESVVVSERAVREGKFTTAQLHEHRALLTGSMDYDEAFSRDVPGLDDEERALLDERGLALVGSRVGPGSVLAGRVRSTRSFLEEPGDQPAPEDRSLRLPAGQDGVVVSARIEHKREASLPKRAAARARVVVGSLRPLEVGDLLGSRHGDRGAIAAIVPEEDMPVLPDGRSVEVLLNPAWIVERGAVGALLELRAGQPGLFVLAPPFDAGVEAGLPSLAASHAVLRDGKTGEPLEAPVAVGSLYLMRLPPLVAGRMEARSVGAYDPLTELPVEGPGEHGGQLIGEEEMGALMAHGAAFTLREMLVGKSDDPTGRQELRDALRSAEEAGGGHVPRGLDALFRELAAAALLVEAEDTPAGLEPGAEACAPDHDTVNSSSGGSRRAEPTAEAATTPSPTPAPPRGRRRQPRPARG